MEKELLFSASKKDFRIDVFRSGGPGGQHQNKTNSGVRITHIESGLACECREFRHQHQNKKHAFEKLAKILVPYYIEKVEKSRGQNNVVVRTYNKPDNRVKDNLSGHQMTYDEVIEKSNIGEMIEKRLLFNNLNEESKCKTK